MIHWIEGSAFICGLGLALLLALVPRFGPGSRHLLWMILPACLSAGIGAFGSELIQLSAIDLSRLSFSLIILAAAGGYVACKVLNRQIRPVYLATVCCLSVFLIGLLYFIDPPYAEGLEAPEEYVALGIIGYFSAIFLLAISVIVLAGLEQILRGATETVRWELKFLFLGIAVIYAAVIYMSSHVLLFSPRGGLLQIDSIGLFHAIFLISCIPIAVSWRRGSDHTQIAVSHGFIYSSITLLCVGVYLIASSLIARWASQWGDLGLPVEALVFLLSALIMGALILGTAFRHRTRAWLRRNIFAGRYDYRRYWLEATERVRSIDPPATTSAALADIVHRAVGAIDVSVWIRRWNPNRLDLLTSIGTISETLDKEASGVIEELLDISNPLSYEEIKRMEDAASSKDFAEKARASLLVPLVSSNRIVGVIAVGADRSGHPYDWEAREFLRALAGHAAGEFHKSELLATLVEARENEAFRAFSTFVLHDLKNFASTLSYIAQNAPRHQSNPEFHKDSFQSVFNTAEKMKRLCNSLRTFSDALAADKKPTDLNQLIRSIADNLNAGIQKHLKLELGSVPPVLVDPEELERVIQNLLINAREAISEDGFMIVKTVNLVDNVEVSVEDNGKGIRRAFMENELFQPFHTTKSGGLGIGLFQSKKIMEAHNGTILVESEEGKGTKVRLLLPVDKQ